MSLDYYNAQEKYWVSPRLVLIYYHDLINKYGIEPVKNERRFKKAIEARAVAINLLGMQKVNPKNYFIQIPKDVNESPDIVTMYLDEYADKPVQLQLQDIEVVEYIDEENRGLLQFLLEEKLEPLLSRKAYDDKTTILCHIKKSGIYKKKEIHDYLFKLNIKPQVMLLGMVNEDTYETTQIYPTFGSVTYSVSEGINAYPKPDSLKVSLGMNKKIIHTSTNLPLPDMEEVFEIMVDKG